MTTRTKKTKRAVAKRSRKHKQAKRIKNGLNPVVATATTIMTWLLQLLNSIKLYHWTTQKYSDHKITDAIHTKLSANIDYLVDSRNNVRISTYKIYTCKLG